MEKKNNSLKKYKQKRNFSITPEPSAKKKTKSIKNKNPLFVVQQHDASHMHYDLRLEIKSVLKSWAVPKGPSLDPEIKRLAVPTEDHPMEYAMFEGIIPEGQYGAGTVMVWDIGSFENIKKENGKIKPIEKCYKDGQIEFYLHGKKLKGSFVLVRTNYQGKKESWLLKKIKDKNSSAKKNPVNTQKKSVITNRTLNQIKKDSELKPELMELIEKKFSSMIEQMINKKESKDV